MSQTTLMWFRRDLRLDDNLALIAACKSGLPVFPIYIHSPEREAKWAAGAASLVWLHHSLKALNESLQAKQSRLHLFQNNVVEILIELCAKLDANEIHASKIYEPHWLRCDEELALTLKKSGIELILHEGELLFNPDQIRSGSDTPFKVFTPFWRNCLARTEGLRPAFDEPEKIPYLPAASRIPASKHEITDLDGLGLLPQIRWDMGVISSWTPGAVGANEALDYFLDNAVEHYQTGRDLPSDRGTSRLSPHLHFGEISARRVLDKLQSRVSKNDPIKKPFQKKNNSEKDPKAKETPAQTFIREIGWREFAHHVLYNFPQTTDGPLRAEFSKFPFRDSQSDFDAWKKGQTGYPLVDAGMRELWQTGWMHNRVRMVVASFLVKHLLLPWQWGAQWFWETLFDADLANNTLGWQWCAGCGADAAPYFRIFNPILQSSKFDEDGEYIGKWVPELNGLSSEHIHTPWLAPESELKAAGVILGENYPLPIVDHQNARLRALAALRTISNSKSAV